MTAPLKPEGPIHFADCITREGNVSVACTPSFDLRRQRWTMIRHHATCPQCRAILRERPVRPDQRHMHNGLPASRVLSADFIRGRSIVTYWRVKLDCGHALQCHRVHQRPGKPRKPPRSVGCQECADAELKP